MGQFQKGFISASSASKIMSSGRGKEEYGKVFYGYARQVASARCGYDITKDISTLSAVEWGLENEWLAVETYTELMLSDVEYPVKFIPHPKRPDSVGCTPDALVGNDGLLEVKCPDSANHLDNLLDDKQLDEYMPQIQFQMWVTGRSWCDWVSFDPRAPKAIQLHRVRVQRDDAYISELARRVDYLETIIADEVKLIQEKLK